MLRLFAVILKIVLGAMVFTASFLWMADIPAVLTGEDETYLIPEKSVIFYSDTTSFDSEKRVVEQEIWDRIFGLIGGAKKYILVDMFLFNDLQINPTDFPKSLSAELTNALLQAKFANKAINMTVVTDPINTVYGGSTSQQFEELRTAGIITLETNLNKLRDSNMLWSSFWRPFFSWSGNSNEDGWLPHPFVGSKDKVTLRSWAALLNFKANHRKLIVADEQVKMGGKVAGHKLVTIITSSNPHDGSSNHGNVALEVRDSLWKSVITSEAEIAKLSGLNIMGPIREGVIDESGDVAVTLLRERAIKEKILNILDSMSQGDVFDMAMFYFSDRDIMQSLIDASGRGVAVRLVLDPNKDAFGFEKNGIPNRPIAKELVRKSSGDINIRWCDTHGEQCHAKLVMGKTGTTTFMILGSANLTRRNLDNFNLEASVIAERSTSFKAWTDAQSYFEKIWSNSGATYTADYTTYDDETFWKSSVYRAMEATGLSTF